MERMIAFCGNDCFACPGYIATRNDDDEARAKIAEQWNECSSTKMKPEDVNCDGCTDMEGRYIGYCAECGVHQCASARGFENCAVCEDYSCETLDEFHKMAANAKENLEEIRKSL